MPVYGGVPPVALTDTVEVPPLHKITVAVDDAISAVGALTV